MENNVPPDSDTDSDQLNAPQLSAIELRILGALMEKQLTTPDAYPLTVNSIGTACNQKSSRDPISHYQPGDIKRTLQQLAEKKFILQEYGSRAEKYSQRFIKHLELGKKQQALLCVMMLRGPQTVSELDTRTQRMCEFTNREDLEYCIDRLCDREVPYAIRLGQQPGQRGERISHLFSGAPEVFAASRSITSEPVSGAVTSSTSGNTHNNTVALLEKEVAALQETVRTLETETSDLKRKLEDLYILTGNEISDAS